MNLSHGEGRLSGCLKDFKQVWYRSEEQWQDERREEFNKAYVEEMESILKNATDSLSELSDVLGKVINTCK